MIDDLCGCPPQYKQSHLGKVNPYPAYPSGLVVVVVCVDCGEIKKESP